LVGLFKILSDGEDNSLRITHYALRITHYDNRKPQIINQQS